MSGLPNVEEWRDRSRALAGRFVRFALENLGTEFPHAASGIEVEGVSFTNPMKRHPVFYGAFDWHSAVHNHWLLVRYLSLEVPDSLKAEIRSFLADRLTPEKLSEEVTFLKRPGNQGFERPYGLAWLLRLAMELQNSATAGAERWSERFLPLEQLAVERLGEYFRALSFPVRAGTHHNTAFSMLLALKHARETGQAAFSEQIREDGLRLFLQDRDYSPGFEPGGEDFLSPALCEIMLMAELLSGEAFARWLKSFLPNRFNEELPWLRPVRQFNESDGRMVHLAGLNLSRAWCLYRLIQSGLLGPALEIKWSLRADQLLLTGLDQVEAGGFRGRHWLPTFATLALQGRLRIGDR